MIAREGHGHLRNFLHPEHGLLTRHDVLLCTGHGEDAALSRWKDGVELGYAEHSHVGDSERAGIVLVWRERARLSLSNQLLQGIEVVMS